MSTSRVDYNHIDIGDKLFCQKSGEIYIVEYSSSSPTHACLKLSNATYDIEDLLTLATDGHAYLYGFELRAIDNYPNIDTITGVLKTYQ